MTTRRSPILILNVPKRDTGELAAVAARIIDSHNPGEEFAAAGTQFSVSRLQTLKTLHVSAGTTRLTITLDIPSDEVSCTTYSPGGGRMAEYSDAMNFIASVVAIGSLL